MELACTKKRKTRENLDEAVIQKKKCKNDEFLEEISNFLNCATSTSSYLLREINTINDAKVLKQALVACLTNYDKRNVNYDFSTGLPQEIWENIMDYLPSNFIFVALRNVSKRLQIFVESKLSTLKYLWYRRSIKKGPSSLLCGDIPRNFLSMQKIVKYESITIEDCNLNNDDLVWIFGWAIKAKSIIFKNCSKKIPCENLRCLTQGYRGLAPSLEKYRMNEDNFKAGFFLFDLPNLVTLKVMNTDNVHWVSDDILSLVDSPNLKSFTFMSPSEQMIIYRDRYPLARNLCLYTRFYNYNMVFLRSDFIDRIEELELYYLIPVRDLVSLLVKCFRSTTSLSLRFGKQTLDFQGSINQKDSILVKGCNTLKEKVRPRMKLIEANIYMPNKKLDATSLSGKNNHRKEDLFFEKMALILNSLASNTTKVIIRNVNPETMNTNQLSEIRNFFTQRIQIQDLCINL